MSEFRLDASARQVLDLMASSGQPPLEQIEPVPARVAARLGFAAMQAPKVPMHAVRDLSLPGPAGPIGLRSYRPTDAAVLPGVVFIHGGGFVIGDLELYDAFCRRLAAASGCAVISVDYRLAPEHRFPAAVDDAIAATRWIAANAAELGLDPQRLAIAGDSAGGNLATVTALTLRDSGGPALRHQLLIYPVTALDLSTDSYRRCGEGYFLSAGLMAYFAGHYLSSPDNLTDWRLAPIRAARHDGLPSATILIAGFDPLRDEGEAYAQALERAGVPVKLIEYRGQFHGFTLADGLVPEAIDATEAMGLALQRALA